MGVVHFGQEYYRPWIKQNAIADFGLAGFWPSLFGCLCAISFALALEQKHETIRASFWTTVGCALYEIIQPTLGTGFFDWLDLLAVFVVGFGWTLGLIVFTKKSPTQNT